MLLTKALLKQIPTLDATAQLTIAEQSAYVKFFNPTGGQTWYITAYNHANHMAFGFADLGDSRMAELGYISMDELESLTFRWGLKVERDRSFSKCPLTQVIDRVRSGNPM